MSGIYIDIHSHKDSQDRPDVIAIKNILIQEAENIVPDQGFFSIGLHPWDTEEQKELPDLPVGLFSRPEWIAVGECGLDRLRGAGMKAQTNLFIQQALLAEAHHKPLFIHCVRAWQEIIALKTEIRPKVPWMIHGYRGKARVAEQLIDCGFYLSFGENILWMNPVLTGMVKDTPINRFFLETDAGRHSIEEIYQAASNIKMLSLSELQDNLIQNFEKVFGIHGASRMAATY